MKQLIEEAILLGEPYGAEHKHPSERTQIEGEISGILSYLRMMEECVLTESMSVRLDFQQEIQERFKRIKFLILQINQ